MNERHTTSFSTARNVKKKAQRSVSLRGTLVGQPKDLAEDDAQQRLAGEQADEKRPGKQRVHDLYEMIVLKSQR